MKKLQLFLFLLLGFWFLSACLQGGDRTAVAPSTYKQDIANRVQIETGTFLPTVSLSYRKPSGDYVTETLPYKPPDPYYRGFTITISDGVPGTVAYHVPAVDDTSAYRGFTGQIRIYNNDDADPHFLLAKSDLMIVGAVSEGVPDGYIDLSDPPYLNRNLKISFFLKDAKGRDAYVDLPPLYINLN